MGQVYRCRHQSTSKVMSNWWVRQMPSPTKHPGVTSRRASAGKRASRSKTANEKAPSAEPLTLSVPEAGRRYLGLGRNASYAAAASGQIPYIRVGKLLRVPVRAMEAMLDAATLKNEAAE